LILGNSNSYQFLFNSNLLHFTCHNFFQKTPNLQTALLWDKLMIIFSDLHCHPTLLNHSFSFPINAIVIEINLIKSLLCTFWLEYWKTGERMTHAKKSWLCVWLRNFLRIEQLFENGVRRERSVEGSYRLLIMLFSSSRTKDPSMWTYILSWLYRKTLSIEYGSIFNMPWLPYSSLHYQSTNSNWLQIET
jgi:hypothetical protein